MNSKLEECRTPTKTPDAAATSARTGKGDVGTASETFKLKLCPDPKQTAAEIVEKTNKLNAMLKELEPVLKPLVAGQISFNLDSSNVVNQLQGKAPVPPQYEKSGYLPVHGHRYNQLLDRAIAIASFLESDAKIAENGPKLLAKGKEEYPHKGSQEEKDNWETNRKKYNFLGELAASLTLGVHKLNEVSKSCSTAEGTVKSFDFSASSPDIRIQLLRQK